MLKLLEEFIMNAEIGDIRVSKKVKFPKIKLE
jgi:hypothetical protein